MKPSLGQKLLIFAGIALNVALMIHVYFIVDGGPAATRQNTGWMAVLNEIPMTVLFFLASVFKPYLMIWSKGKEHPAIISSAGTVMLLTTACACAIDALATSPAIRDLTLYINWVFLWAASAYYVLIPQRITPNE